MPVALMRFAVESAGNLDKLHRLISLVDNIPGDKDKISESFRNQESYLGYRRAAEPYFSLARGLGIVDEGWKLSFGAGRSLLKLWSEKEKRPIYTLLTLFLIHDRSFLVPLLRSATLFSPIKRQQIEESARVAWEEMWEKSGEELATMEPPVPRNLTRRTLLHYGIPRWRIITHGLGLRLTHLKTFSELFWPYAFKELPNDYFGLLGEVFTARKPPHLKGSQLDELINRAYDTLKGMEYASVFGALCFINEHILPTFFVDYRTLLKILRSSNRYELQPSFSPEDFLFRVK